MTNPLATRPAYCFGEGRNQRASRSWARCGRYSYLKLQFGGHAALGSTKNKVNQERVDFEVINAGESRTRTIEVTNGNPAAPYVISGLEVESKYNDQIKAELTEHEKGLRYTITLTTDPALTARFFRGILKIKSEHGDLAEKQIHFHGWVKKAE